MQAVHPAPAHSVTVPPVGTHIPRLERPEALALAAEELRRFIGLIETLTDADWNQPTACTLWTVKDIVAHQAGHVAGFVSLAAYVAQTSPGLLWPYLRRGLNFLDALNQAQVDQRRDHPPAQIIDEIKTLAEPSLRGRARFPRWLLTPTLPLPNVDQPRSLGYLFDVTYTRDMWMHRIDIEQAAGRPVSVADAHDQRMIALIVLDLAEKCVEGLGGRAAILSLTGAAGGRFQLGAATTPTVTVELDVPTFALLTSGRMTAAAARASSTTHLVGDTAFGQTVIDFCFNRVLY